MTLYNKSLIKRFVMVLTLKNNKTNHPSFDGTKEVTIKVNYS